MQCAFVTFFPYCRSLEDLKLDMHIGDADGEPVSMDDFSFGIDGLKLHGAASRKNQIYIEERDVIVTDLSMVRLRWVKKEEGGQHQAAAADIITLPVYLNSNRRDVLFNADFHLGQGQRQALFIEKGVALIANV